MIKGNKVVMGKPTRDHVCQKIMHASHIDSDSMYEWKIKLKFTGMKGIWDELL